MLYAVCSVCSVCAACPVSCVRSPVCSMCSVCAAGPVSCVVCSVQYVQCVCSRTSQLSDRLFGVAGGRPSLIWRPYCYRHPFVTIGINLHSIGAAAGCTDRGGGGDGTATSHSSDVTTQNTSSGDVTQQSDVTRRSVRMG